jgi:hypothetical protein
MSSATLSAVVEHREGITAAADTATGLSQAFEPLCDKLEQLLGIIDTVAEVRNTCGTAVYFSIN